MSPRPLLLALLLAACAPPPEPGIEPPREAGPVTLSGWTLQASAAAGAALVKTGPDGAEELRIACRRNPADLWVAVAGFRPIPSEERLSLGANDEVVALVARPDARPAGVEASGPIPEALLARLETGAAVGVSYGAQTLRTFGPDPALAARFAAACRATGVR